LSQSSSPRKNKENCPAQRNSNKSDNRCESRSLRHSEGEAAGVTSAAARTTPAFGTGSVRPCWRSAPGRLLRPGGSRAGRAGSRVRRLSIELRTCCGFSSCPCGTSMAWPSASLRRRSAPRPGDVLPARGPHHCAPPGPGPGPGRALRSAARPGAAPGPCPLYEPAAGPSRARSTLSRDPRFARRAHGPRGARCDAAGGRVVTVTAWEARGGRDLRAPPASTRLGPAYAWEPGGTCCPAPSLAMQSARPNTSWQSVIGLRPNRCLRMNLPYRVYRVTS
jgi:hypothetical protein